MSEKVVKDALVRMGESLAILKDTLDPQPRVPFAWEWDVDDKRVTFHCTHIDAELRGEGLLGVHGGLSIESSACPRLGVDDDTIIFLRGLVPEKDDRLTWETFSSHKHAIAFRDRAQAALEHVRDEIAARWEAEAEPVPRTGASILIEQAAIAAFEERWKAIASMDVEHKTPKYCAKEARTYHVHDYSNGTHHHVHVCSHGQGPFDPVKAEAKMRAWFKRHVAGLSIDDMDDIWKERQGGEIYPYWFLAGGATRLGASCPTPKRYQAQIFIGNMLVGESDVSPTDAVQQAHIKASYAWAEMQVAP